MPNVSISEGLTHGDELMIRKSLIAGIVTVIVGLVLFLVGWALTSYGVYERDCIGGGTFGDLNVGPTCFEDTDYPFFGLGYTLMVVGVVILITGIIAIPVGVMESL